ncbi:hypothetical protein N7456_010827 [Penicillium angulare]|uniref:BTB domain-containing protein n=1 Tax=Penicillium angulare TaxID=116970 RepID=A0A9W9JZL8_9EURO|nr:hypothetical protein N7456_010827 [Penicillium angulare]
MEPATHVLDPNGEVVIILRNETPNNVKRARQEPPNKARKRAEATEGTTEHRIQVSAKHLTFVSPVFKKLLTGGLKESATFAEKGSVEVTADDWQLEAFLIVLHAIHCQYHEVPKKVTLQLLSDIAVIADYYDCAQALHIMKEIWVEALEEKVPSQYSTELMRWLWVSWFFNIDSKFEEATSIAMTWSDNVIASLGFPIPGKLIGKRQLQKIKK